MTVMTDLKIVAKKDLLFAIKRIGMRQKELAERVGCTRQHINVVIKQKGYISEILAKRICDELGKQFDDLFELIEVERKVTIMD